MGMCRFFSKDDDGYQKIGGELRTFISAIQASLKEEAIFEKERQSEPLEDQERQ
jgi:hypothetical protein